MDENNNQNVVVQSSRMLVTQISRTPPGQISKMLAMVQIST